MVWQTRRQSQNFAYLPANEPTAIYSGKLGIA
jgi:hypothetical protein